MAALAKAEEAELAAAASAMAGGTIRMDKSNGSFAQYIPGEHTLPNHSMRLLQSIGHSGVVMASLFARVRGVNLRAGQRRYLVPALELRRLIAQSKAENVSFFIEYAKLPITGYNQLTARNPNLPKVVYTWNAAVGEATCLADGEPCTATEPALQLWPPPGLLGMWALKVMMHYPVPLIEDHDLQGVPCYDG
eukprot:gnl/MRDRNA2_/MRDRNA2_151881_c0_seq1.p1 gnl/MRDRNA2_/MRDRNA2_151881_c0~~gnl/MRDRNA2_/MRDRNA2_151881_c0_seq1.p1  ORF type:complete len:208 (-),score=49.61 gnl/MRDRNA2_/MRDRNA2_151881_c0_seq1:184-759(-)